MTEKPKSKDESSSQGNGGGNKLDYTRYLRMMQETLDKSGGKKTVNRFETEHGKEEEEINSTQLNQDTIVRDLKEKRRNPIVGLCRRMAQRRNCK